MSKANKHILNKISYRQVAGEKEINSLRMMFMNGERSPVFETPDQGFSVTKSFTVKPSPDIRYVSMRMRFGLVYDGLRFFDKN